MNQSKGRNDTGLYENIPDSLAKALMERQQIILKELFENRGQ